jgi:hypothetical protein
MDASAFLSSSFIKLEEVRRQPFSDIVLRVDPGKFDRLNVTFEGGGTLSLNATNLKTLIQHFGRETDSWIGKQVELFVGKLNFEGEPVDAILVKPISGAIPAEQRPKPAPASPRQIKERTGSLPSDLDDEIPF